MMNIMVGWIQKMLMKFMSFGPVPQHVAFIMDGNRRFAKRSRLARTIEGHFAGFEGLQKTLEWCYHLGIKAVSIYAFSTENFNRTPEEVCLLMDLAVNKFEYFHKDCDMIRKYDVKVCVIGELEMLPENVREAAYKAMEMTKSNKGRIINICSPYSSKAELITTANAYLEKGPNTSDLSKEDFGKMLYTAPCSPPIDIMVRTGGDHRMSEFLTWQCSEAGSQLEFLDVLWPDLRFRHFLPILLRYQLHKLALPSKSGHPKIL